MSELTREQIEKWRFWLLERRDSLDVAREANALCDLALRALSDHAEAGQPVAWVYLHKNKLSETFSHQPPDRVFNLDEYTVTPLYAHPPAPRATEQAGWEPIANAPMYVYGRDALVGQHVSGFGWKKVTIWEREWTRDQCIERGATHWWPHLRDLPLPPATSTSEPKGEMR
jgi:hypothetical protein